MGGPPWPRRVDVSRRQPAGSSRWNRSRVPRGREIGRVLRRNPAGDLRQLLHRHGLNHGHPRLFRRPLSRRLSRHRHSLYRAHDAHVEYDFELRPGANPDQIRLAFRGATPRIEADGSLRIGNLRQRPPRVFQDGNEIASSYRPHDDGTIGIALPAYDSTQPLLIDPVIEFATYLGGPAEETAFELDVDSQGYIYVAATSNAPVTPGLDPFLQSGANIASAYMFKLSPDARRVIWYAVLSGEADTRSQHVALDPSGNLLWTGVTAARKFPLKNAFQTTRSAPVYTGFVTLLAADGKTLLYSSYLGGSGEEALNAGIAVDADGNAFVGGVTNSRDFPMVNALQSRFLGNNTSGIPDIPPLLPPFHCFVSKISPTGKLLFSTYLGSSGIDACHRIALAPDGDLWIAGHTNGDDLPMVNAVQTSRFPVAVPAGLEPVKAWLTTGFLTKLRADGQAILVSTYIGGATNNTVEAMALDRAGNMYITGVGGSGTATTVGAFQTASPAGQDPNYVMKLSPDLRRVLFSTYLGARNASQMFSLAVADDGTVWYSGVSSSPNFPTRDPLQTYHPGPTNDGVDIALAQLSADGSSLLFGTYLGGDDYDRWATVTARNGAVYLSGGVGSPGLPTKAARQTEFGGGTDMYLVKFAISGGGSPPLAASQTSLAFTGIQGSTAPPDQTINISGPAFTAAGSASWLAVAAAAGMITVQVNPAGLAAGTYQGSVKITAGTDSLTIPVTLNLIGAPPVIDSITPGALHWGLGDMEMTIHGGPFNGSPELFLYGMPWAFTPVTRDASGALHFTLPAAFIANRSILMFNVRNPGSLPSNAAGVWIQ